MVKEVKLPRNTQKGTQLATRAVKKRVSAKASSGNGSTAKVSPRTIQRTLAEYPEEYVTCRGGHDFKHKGWYRGFGGITVKVSQCASCTAVRRQFWNSRGQVAEPSRIDYPTGYIIEGMGRDRSPARKEIMKRAKVFDSFDQLIGSIGPIEKEDRR